VLKFPYFAALNLEGKKEYYQKDFSKVAIIKFPSVGARMRRGFSLAFLCHIYEVQLKTINPCMPLKSLALLYFQFFGLNYKTCHYWIQMNIL
jgi:hypothetical protein